MTVSARRAKSAHRALHLGMLFGSGLLIAAAFLPWWRRDYRDPLSGEKTVDIAGNVLVAGLVPVALLAIAGWAASLLVRGTLRRALGGIVLVAAAGIAVWSFTGLARPSDSDFALHLTRPAAALGGATLSAFGPITAIVGALSVLVASVILTFGPARAARSRGDYDVHQAPAQRRASARAEAQGGSVDAAADDARLLWQSLDLGIDPTDEAAPERGPDPHPDQPSAPGREHPGSTDTMNRDDRPPSQESHT